MYVHSTHEEVHHMFPNMFPTYELLAWRPDGFAFWFYMFVLGAMFIMRRKYQKQGFQFSASAFFGGAALFWTYAIAGDVLQTSSELKFFPAFQTLEFHGGCLFIGACAGVIFQSIIHAKKKKEYGLEKAPWGTLTDKADLVYALFFLPIIVYLCLVTIPMPAIVGGFWVMMKTAFFYSVFVWTWRYDVRYKLLDQVKASRENPITSVIDSLRKKV